MLMGFLAVEFFLLLPCSFHSNIRNYSTCLNNFIISFNYKPVTDKKKSKTKLPYSAKSGNTLNFEFFRQLQFSMFDNNIPNKFIQIILHIFQGHF